MRKQLLLFGASLATAMGATLVMLTLVLTLTNPVYAITESSVDCGTTGGICVKSVLCAESNCAALDGGCACPNSVTSCSCSQVNAKK